MSSTNSNSGQLSPQVLEWAASVIVKEKLEDDVIKNGDDSARAHAQLVNNMTTAGISGLKKKELRWVWDALKFQSFVRKNQHGYKTHISTSALKHDYVLHVENYLRLPEASATLKPLDNSGSNKSNDIGNNGSNHNANEGTPGVALAAAIPAAAPYPVGPNIFQQQQQFQQYQRLQQQHRQLYNGAGNNFSFGAPYGGGASFGTIANAHQLPMRSGPFGPFPSAYHHNHNYQSTTGTPSNSTSATSSFVFQPATATNSNKKPPAKAPNSTAAKSSVKATAKAPSTADNRASSTKSPKTAPGSAKASRKRPSPAKPKTAEKAAKTNNQDQTEMPNPWAGIVDGLSVADLSAAQGHPPSTFNFSHASSQSHQQSNGSSSGAPGNESSIQWEGGHDPTDEDIRLFAALCGMGFPRSDAMKGILDYRKQNPSNHPTADEIMLFLINQKEEAQPAQPMMSDEEIQLEEARIEDRVREESEKLKEAESVRVEEMNRQKLMGATFDQLLHPQSDDDRKLMFPKSFLLRHDPIKSLLQEILKAHNHLSAKKSLLELLKLEKKARNWYDSDISKSYFINVLGRRLMETSVASAQQAIDLMLNEVQNAMFMPSEQVDGVPRIFLEARKEDKENSEKDKKSNSKEHDDDDDDEIVVLSSAEFYEDPRKPAAAQKKGKEQVIEL